MDKRLIKKGGCDGEASYSKKLPKTGIQPIKREVPGKESERTQKEEREEEAIECVGLVTQKHGMTASITIATAILILILCGTASASTTYEENGTTDSYEGFFCTTPTNAYDADWSTKGYATSIGGGISCTMRTNYTYPSSYYNFTIQYKGGISGGTLTQNLSLNTSCSSTPNIRLYIDSYHKRDGVDVCRNTVYCMNGTDDLFVMYDYSVTVENCDDSRYVFETGIYWFSTDPVPSSAEVLSEGSTGMLTLVIISILILGMVSTQLKTGINPKYFAYLLMLGGLVLGLYFLINVVIT